MQNLNTETEEKSNNKNISNMHLKILEKIHEFEYVKILTEYELRVYDQH